MKKSGVLQFGTPFFFLIRRSALQVLITSLRATTNPDVARCLRQVRDALSTQTPGHGTRQLDRLWRCQPEEAALLSPIYGRLLMLEGRDYDAALRLLQRAADLAPDPDLAAMIALALLRLGRLEDAHRDLRLALGGYSVESNGLLALVAREVAQHPGVGAAGWIGRGPGLELVGELVSDDASSVLDVTVDGKVAFTQLLPAAASDDRRSFHFNGPQFGLDKTLEVRSRGIMLLGSGARVPPDFGLDGRAQDSGRRLTGWARLGWLPTRPLRLRVEDENQHRAGARRAGAALPCWRWPFLVDLRATRMRGQRLQISARLPDGSWRSLPDSPLLLDPAVRLPARMPAGLPRWRAGPSRRGSCRALSHNQRRVDIVIPVFRGREHTLACIDSVLATIDDSAQIIVVDDATDDLELAGALDALAAKQRITLLRNDQNQGFVASVNRAATLHLEHDVLLLNSDTLVFDDWLARLRAAAYSDSAVGTVTPLSNNGSIASYPSALGAPIDPEEGPALHALAASTHSGTRPAIPVGVGFCLYMRRDCLRDVGSLDADVFGKGYGEETDFCLRARRRGWSHRLAADVFVYHAGGLSFGARRSALLDRSARLINRRHPGYDRFVSSFIACDPLHPVRRALDERRLVAFEGRFVLLVAPALAGGVTRYVGERCRALRAQGVFPLILRPAEPGNSRRCELWSDATTLPNLSYDIPGELSALRTLLTELPLEAIEIQHFLNLDARVIDVVRALPVPYDVLVHDYAWICPRITLIDGSGRYCGEPPVSVCQACVRRHGGELGETISVTALRARSARWLRSARRVMAPSRDTASRLRRHFEGLDVEVCPHAPPVVATPAATPGRNDKTLRVAVLGAIGKHKGYSVLLDCARDARARDLPIEFVVIGYTHDDAPLLATGKVFVTGRYGEGEAPHLIRREQPDLAWLPSVVPETWCYTLDLALSAGLPVVAFDLGAIAERLRAAGTGTLLPLGLKPRQITDWLLELTSADGLSAETVRRSVQTPLPEHPDDVNIAATQPSETRMASKSNGEQENHVPEERLGASVQVLPLPPGLYLFSVKSASPLPGRSAGQLSVPAVHVGLGPGVRSAQVEFVAGPNTEGAWLFAPGDLLVTRINSPGTTLILTSIRAPGGELLSITVERLDARSTAADPAQAAAAPAPAANPPTPQHAQPQQQPQMINANQADRPAPIESAVSRVPGPIPVPVQVGAHIRKRGDMVFADAPWAGRIAPGLWIESFSVRPLQRFAAQDIEYKALTGSGFETPWLSDDKMCGTKGMAVPLVGFAIRFKHSPVTAAYDCEYSGYFQSGVTIGPLRNGAPCRSTVANDPLEGIQVRLVKRSSPVAVAASATSVTAASVRSAPEKPAPSRSSFRPNGSSGKSSASIKRKRDLPIPVKAAKQGALLHGSSRGIERATRRHSSRRP